MQEKRYVLIDDDPSFRTMFLRAANMHGIWVDVFGSLEEFRANEALKHYDMAIIDYDLGKTDGAELKKDLDVLCKDTPMIIVNRKDQQLVTIKWPESVKQLIPKSMGYVYILEQAEHLTS